MKVTTVGIAVCPYVSDFVPCVNMLADRDFIRQLRMSQYDNMAFIQLYCGIIATETCRSSAPTE